MTNKYKMGDKVKYSHEGKLHEGFINRIDIDDCYPYIVDGTSFAEKQEDLEFSYHQDFIIEKVTVPIQELLDERKKAHGEFRLNHKTIAAKWSEHLGVTVTALDVALMMIELKIARIQNGEEYNKDNYDDIIGYATLAQQLEKGE